MTTPLIAMDAEGNEDDDLVNVHNTSPLLQNTETKLLPSNLLEVDPDLVKSTVEVQPTNFLDRLKRIRKSEQKGKVGKETIAMLAEE